MSINPQSQFQGQQKYERGVFILELQIGKTYILTEDEKNDVTGTVFIKKGSRVRVKTLGIDSVVVQDLSDDMIGDGVWMTHVSYLMPLAEASAKNTECFVKEIGRAHV